MKQICTLVLFLLAFSFAAAQDSTNAFMPKKAAIWSLIPSGGQIYNKKFLKAGLILALEGWAYTSYSYSTKYFNNYESYTDLPHSKQRYLQKRNKYIWWMGFIWFYGMIDAIVDAHLSPFHDVMDATIENSEGEIND